VIDFCQKHGVGTIFAGDPRGVRDLEGGRHHNRLPFTRLGVSPYPGTRGLRA
jgi:hypothetical protein